jgi:hypothetical protein
MDTRLLISSLLGILVYFVCIFFLLKSKKLELKYTLLWILGGVCMLLVVLLFKPFMVVMNFLGIVEPVNGMFAIMIFLLIMILISMTSVLSLMNNKLRSLTQKCALYEKRLRDLEEKLK